MSKKMDAKTFALQKRQRRQWLTFVRMCRYGVNNFSRNIWLTVAATAVMTITLLIVFMTLAARTVLIDSIAEIRDKVDMSIYVKNDISESNVKTIQTSLEKLASVRHVSYISPEQGRADFAKQNKADNDTLAALNEGTNEFPGIFRINPVDINKTDELRQFVETNKTLKENIDPRRQPSFAGERRSAIESIGNAVSFAEKAGLTASIIFIAISSLIIFNTIRMAIFNRKDEIQMMKLIGADRSFIRGPFVVEAVVYGFFAAITATVLGIGALFALREPLLRAEVAVNGVLSFVTYYSGLILLGMILLGALIGITSSLLATRRYLKI